MTEAISWMLRSVGLAAGISLLVCRLLIVAASRWKLAGKPALRRSTKKPTVPHLGSLGLAVACVVTLMIVTGGLGFASQPAWQGWVLGSAWLLVLGLIDDLWWELSPLLKAAGQVLAATILITSGISIHIVYFPLWLNIILSLLWVLGLTNAINLLDILDALAATITLVAVATFGVLALWAGQPDVAVVSASIVGALCGFLVFNWPPARLYMGDAGSQWLGFTLATLSLAIHYAPLGREIALATPLVVLGLPLYDLAFVVVMRLRRGLSPFQKSNDHFALRLVSKGSGPQQSVAAMAGLATAFALIGLFVSRAPNGLGAVAVAAVVLVAIIWGRRIAAVEVDG